MPATIRKTEHLAAGDGQLERLIDLSFPGMAHFGGTGREVPRSARACKYFLPCEKA